jgi:7,8-dihydroneopterin aldolase/epimerase/oxygenase
VTFTPPAGPADRIELRGLRALGTHGVLPEERERAQPFEIDVAIEVDLRAAGSSDELSDTVDYGTVADAVAAAVAGPHTNLIEHLAERVAKVVLDASPRSTATTVSVRKLRPPVAVHMDSAGVTVRRSRNDLE